MAPWSSAPPWILHVRFREDRTINKKKIMFQTVEFYILDFWMANFKTFFPGEEQRRIEWYILQAICMIIAIKAHWGFRLTSTRCHLCKIHHIQNLITVSDNSDETTRVNNLITLSDNSHDTTFNKVKIGSFTFIGTFIYSQYCRQSIMWRMWLRKWIHFSLHTQMSLTHTKN